MPHQDRDLAISYGILMTKTPKNIAASVRARLLRDALARGEDFNLTLQRYAAERFLYRLGQSPYRERFVLKGAMLFAIWGGAMYRPTRDLDLAGYGSHDELVLKNTIREICSIPCPSDGIEFPGDTLSSAPIRDDNEYGGIRVHIEARLEKARIQLQIDVGFGDAIVPAATDHVYPTLLDAPAPMIRAYPREVVVAEKLHAAVVLGTANSRMKDFYDLFVLALRFSFKGADLKDAINATFERRRTDLPNAMPAALTPTFYSEEAKAVQWRSYLGRNSLPTSPGDFNEVGKLIRAFLLPLWDAMSKDTAFEVNWQPGGPWMPA